MDTCDLPQPPGHLCKHGHQNVYRYFPSVGIPLRGFRGFRFCCVRACACKRMRWGYLKSTWRRVPNLNVRCSTQRTPRTGTASPIFDILPIPLTALLLFFFRATLHCHSSRAPETIRGACGSHNSCGCRLLQRVSKWVYNGAATDGWMQAEPLAEKCGENKENERKKQKRKEGGRNERRKEKPA